MTEGTLFALTDNAWVIWICTMGLFTTMQVMVNIARAVRHDE